MVILSIIVMGSTITQGKGIIQRIKIWGTYQNSAKLSLPFSTILYPLKVPGTLNICNPQGLFEYGMTRFISVCTFHASECVNILNSLNLTVDDNTNLPLSQRRKTVSSL